MEKYFCGACGKVSEFAVHEMVSLCTCGKSNLIRTDDVISFQNDCTNCRTNGAVRSVEKNYLYVHSDLGVRKVTVNEKPLKTGSDNDSLDIDNGARPGPEWDDIDSEFEAAIANPRS